MAQGKVLIAGASGLVGTAALKLFSGLPEFEVVAVSRRPPVVPLGKARHLSVDLLDPAQCREAFGRMSDVTHIIYTALNEKLDDIVAGWRDPGQTSKNAAMLVNLFDPLIAAAKGFRHISLVHGLKAYGNHVGAPITLPMRESLPRYTAVPNFYYDQEDYIAAKQAGQGWSWTVLRPAMIAGDAVGASMNPYLILAVFAALRKWAGLDLPMPTGNPLVSDATDADLIAEALHWAMDAPKARNDVFNITNGDLIALHDGIPVAAECLNIPLGPPRAYDIVTELRALQHLWPEVVRKNGLRAPENLDDLLGAWTEIGGGWTIDMPPTHTLAYGLASTIKIRQAGFHGCCDTLDMLRKYIRRFQELKLIPSFT